MAPPIYSEVKIANMALDMLGLGPAIQSLSDSNDRAEKCNTWYPVARDSVLESYTWPFAKKAQPLGLVEEFTSDTAEWAYSYRYPHDCVKCVRLVNGVVPVAHPIAFDMRQDATGRLIMTDLEDAEIEGIFPFDDAGEWSTKFALAVASHLAELIAKPLRVDANIAAQTAQAARESLALAKLKATGERRNRREPESRYVRARGGYPYGDFPDRTFP